MASWGRKFSSILGKKNIMENQAELVKKFTDVMADFTAYFGKHLPDDVQAKLEELRAE